MPSIIQTGLLKRPNWNMRRINKFYPVPDSWAPNPKCETFRSMKLYSLEKIREIEASPEFQADLLKYPSRKRGRVLTD